MSDRNISGKSVAAFLFMPQFRLSMPAFGHIGIVFVRTLALMFIQSGLLEPNHPAKFYGMNNYKKIRIRDLIGEAWYNLRTGEDKSLYQYSIFGAVVLMILAIITTIFLAVTNTFFNTEVIAQIFSLAAGPATDFTNPQGIAGNGLFYSNVTIGAGGAANVGTHPDIAIDLLNQVLRLGAFGTGGALQNGLAAALGTYSAAVMVIAAFIAFWAIVSVVTDTARTGQFGGGRHNMVWAPIRFVFALGILVPIGGGFNGGQLIVLKLAEWGSNLGSNIWSTYVVSVLNDTDRQSLIGDLATPQVTMSTIGRLLEIKVCQKAYNLSHLQATGNGATLPLDPMTPPGPAPAAWITQNTGFPQFIDAAGNAQAGDHFVFSYGNQINRTLCGVVKLPNHNAYNLTSVVGTDPTAQAQIDMRNAYRAAYLSLFTGGAGANVDELACGIAAEYFSDSAAPGTLYGAAGSPCARADYCNSGANVGKDGIFPDQSCLNAMFTNFNTNFDAGIVALKNNLDGSVNAALRDQVSAAGWAGMGVWYHKISQINVRQHEAANTAIQIEGPNLATMGGIASIGYSALSFASRHGGSASASVDITNQALDGLSEWWKTSLSPSLGVTGLSLQAKAQMGNSYSEASTGVTRMGGDKNGGKLAAEISKMFGSDSLLSSFMITGSSDTYPMAELANVGMGIVQWSMAAYAVMLGASVAGAIPFLKGSIIATMAGPVGSLLGTMGAMGLTAGAVLLYYVPLIPWIRVTFAVLAWIISVFEAVVTIPVVALAHLRTDGDGLMGPMAQSAYVLWLNLLLRPALTVIGFIASLLIFNAMVDLTLETYKATLSGLTAGGGSMLFGQIVYTVIFMSIIYTLANSTFKMVDILPNSTMRWLGVGGDGASENDSAEHMTIAAAGFLASRAGPIGGMGGGGGGGPKPSTGIDGKTAGKGSVPPMY